jgi:hypothetical protein
VLLAALADPDRPGCAVPVECGPRPEPSSFGCGVWTLRTVATILGDPRYTGREVWNRQRTDHDSAAMGRKRAGQRWNRPGDWVIPKVLAHLALVSENDFIAAQAVDATPAAADGATRRYALVGHAPPVARRGDRGHDGLRAPPARVIRSLRTDDARDGDRATALACYGKIHGKQARRKPAPTPPMAGSRGCQTLLSQGGPAELKRWPAVIDRVARHHRRQWTVAPGVRDRSGPVVRTIRCSA